MDKGLFDASPTGLAPLDHGARTICAIATYGKKPILVSVRGARNPEFNALAHIVFGRIAAGIGVPMDAVKQWLKEKTGRYDLYEIKSFDAYEHAGKFTILKRRRQRRNKTKVYHSLSFESMSEEQFRAFWTDSIPFIAQLIGGFDTEEGQKILAIMSGEDRNFHQ